MKATSILEYITADGLTLSIADDGNLEIDGDQNTIDSWLETIKENKAAILAELGNAACNVTVTREVTSSSALISKEDTTRAFYRRSSETTTGKYSVVVTDASTDPVLVEVTIHGLASFTMEIPHAHYDGIALLQVIDQHSVEAEPERRTA